MACFFMGDLVLLDQCLQPLLFIDDNPGHFLEIKPGPFCRLRKSIALVPPVRTAPDER